MPRLPVQGTWSWGGTENTRQGRDKSPKQTGRHIFSCCSQYKANIVPVLMAHSPQGFDFLVQHPPSGCPIGRAGASLSYSGFTNHLGNLQLIEFHGSATGAASRAQSPVQLSSAPMGIWPSWAWHCLCLSFPLHKSAAYLLHNRLLPTALKHASVGSIIVHEIKSVQFLPCRAKLMFYIR